MNVWVREFGDKRFESSQWVEGSLMVEKYGPARSRFTVTVADGVVHYDTARVSLLGVPVPMPLAVTTSATVKGTDDGFLASVVIRSALLGVLCRYDARMKVT